MKPMKCAVLIGLYFVVFMICGSPWIAVAVGQEGFHPDDDTIVQLLKRILSKPSFVL